MNVRKPVDYSTMYRELTAILTQNLSQMVEVYAIGKAISQRPEKGAAVAAEEFLLANFPDRTGFSPRNVRRMRDFYRTYENDQTLLRLAMKIGWTLNVVIMEAELTREIRKWYLEQARERQWSKAVLLEKLASTAHLEKPLDVGTDTCYTGDKDIKTCVKWTSTHDILGKSHCWIGQLWLLNLWRYISTRLLRRVSQKMFYVRC